MNFIYYINRLIVTKCGESIILIQNIYNAVFTNKCALYNIYKRLFHTQGS